MKPCKFQGHFIKNFLFWDFTSLKKTRLTSQLHGMTLQRMIGTTHDLALLEVWSQGLTLNECQTWPGESLYWEECCQSSKFCGLDQLDQSDSILWTPDLTFFFGGEGGMNWWIDLRMMRNTRQIWLVPLGGLFVSKKRLRSSCFL